MPNPGNVIGKGKLYSKDYQPSPEAKSAGWESFQQRKKFKDEFFSEFAKITIDGKPVETFKESIKVLQRAIFDKSIDLKDRAELILKINQFIAPTEKQEISAEVNIITTEKGVEKLADILLEYDNVPSVPKSP